jgi:ACS family glucarate transporter-like MFS transporter
VLLPSAVDRVARPTHARYVVVAALCVAAALAYVQRNSYGGAETTIRGELGLTPDQTGDAAGLFFLSYAVLQAPAGWLAQRAGPRWTVVCCAAGWSAALGLCALAVNPYTLIGGRMLMGVFQAGLLPSATVILAAWLPPTQRGTASGLLNSFMLIGGALNSNFTGLLLAPLGWRGLFLLYAAPGLTWALLFALWFRNRPADHPGVNDAELAVIGCPPRFRPSVWNTKYGPPVGADDPPVRLQSEAAPADEGFASAPGVRPAPAARNPPAALPAFAAAPRPAPWWAPFLSVAMYCICLQQFCRAGANRFSDLWLATYLQEARQVGKEWANQLTSLPQWAGVFGGFIGGLLSDYLLSRTGRRRVARKGLAVASLAGCLALYSAAYAIPDAVLATVVFAAGMFVFFFSSTCAYAVTMDVGGRNLGVVFGLMNMAGNFGAWSFTALVPRLNAYNGGDWTATLALFAGLHVAALAFWLPLDPDGVIGEPPPPPKE